MVYADRMVPAEYISSLIDQYANYYLAGRLERPVSEPIELQECDVGRLNVPGVYLVYRKDLTLIYIGMSRSDIGRRLATARSRSVQASSFWRDRPPALIQYVQLSNGWEAPSLEAFLEDHANAYPRLD